MKKLTTQQRDALVKLEKQIPHKGVSTRIKIILALDDGYTSKDVARILLLDEDTITKWKKLYKQSRYLSDWLGDENNGYRGRLTREQEKMVEKYVKDEIITDCAQVVLYVQNTFGINYT